MRIADRTVRRDAAPARKRCSRSPCERRLTFAEAAVQYGRLRRVFGGEKAMALSPRCQKCTTITLREANL